MRCTKCGAELSENARFCPACGSSVAAGGSAWNYTIEGDSLPVLTVRLKAGDKMISQVGGRAWTRGPVETETRGGGVGKALGRLFTGESLFMSEYTAMGPAEIAFTSSFPGKIVARELAAGESIICQKSAFLCASYGINLSVFFQKKFGAGLLGGEGFLMERVTGPGIVFMEIDGFCKEYTLAAGERIVCDTGLLAFMDESCSVDVQTVKGAKNIFLGGEGLFDTVVTGPGRVYLQSMTISALARQIAPHVTSKS